MKKELILLLFTILISCKPREYDFHLSGKWVLLTTELEGKEIRNDIIHSPLLSYTIRDKKFYPAIRFNVSDSTVMVPGNNRKTEKLIFSADKNLENIQFLKKKVSDSTSLIDELFIRNFAIEKDKRSGRLKLESDSTIIYMMPAERFARQINSRLLD